MNVKARSIALCIVLSIITLGIYGIYWFIKLNDEANFVSQEPKPTSGGVAFLLSLVTCSIYAYYWAYKQGEKLDRASTMRGLPAGSKGILYLILCLFGLSIVAFALMQDTINKFPDTQQA